MVAYLLTVEGTEHRLTGGIDIPPDISPLVDISFVKENWEDSSDWSLEIEGDEVTDEIEDIKDRVIEIIESDLAVNVQYE